MSKITILVKSSPPIKCTSQYIRATRNKLNSVKIVGKCNQILIIYTQKTVKHNSNHVEMITAYIFKQYKRYRLVLSPDTRFSFFVFSRRTAQLNKIHPDSSNFFKNDLDTILFGDILKIHGPDTYWDNLSQDKENLRSLRDFSFPIYLINSVFESWVGLSASLITITWYQQGHSTTNLSDWIWVQARRISTQNPWSPESENANNQNGVDQHPRKRQEPILILLAKTRCGHLLQRWRNASRRISCK